MTDLDDKVALLSDNDNDQADSGQIEAPPGYQAAIDTAPTINATNNYLYPLAEPRPLNGTHGQTNIIAVVVTQPTRMVHQNTQYLDKHISTMYALFVCSCLACCFCWPLALCACMMTARAYREASEGRDPRPLMMMAAAGIVISFVVGIPASIWFISTRV